jgi:hypothetical protein
MNAVFLIVQKVFMTSILHNKRILICVLTDIFPKNRNVLN